MKELKKARVLFFYEFLFKLENSGRSTPKYEEEMTKC